MAGLPAVDNTDSDLRAGFDAFIEASHRLEQRYAELKARAAAVDEQLQATNQRLAQTVAERDAIFAALPLGVIARRHDGTVTFQNDEAERLCQRLAIIDNGKMVAQCAPQSDVGGLQ